MAPSNAPVAYPIEHQTNAPVMHELETVIARHTEDVPNTSFLQAAKQKVSDRLVHDAHLLSVTW